MPRKTRVCGLCLLVLLHVCCEPCREGLLHFTLRRGSVKVLLRFLDDPRVDLHTTTNLSQGLRARALVFTFFAQNRRASLFQACCSQQQRCRGGPTPSKQNLLRPAQQSAQHVVSESAASAALTVGGGVCLFAREQIRITTSSRLSTQPPVRHLRATAPHPSPGAAASVAEVAWSKRDNL